MESLSNTALATLTSFIEFWGQKEIIGLCVGAAGSAIWYRVTGAEEQKQKNKQVISIIRAAIQETSRIATQNLGIVDNELTRLHLEKLTLEPHTDFIPTSADLLLLVSNFKFKKSVELWSSLKKIESLSSQAERLVLETTQLRRAIKLENRAEIYRFELIPYLRQHDELHARVINQIVAECQTSNALLESVRT
ncbi:hypothetical protein SAMN05216344_1512 [Polaromonas sp. OV174]|uniref:hypothetical protein n=1 Tax=Polaromonas sp. OV174 TaxID=1855300 RepID=UPI0008E44EF0|nr:hypothetical protein [Polaromonas sp. OV174]SFC81230.1 hypothetical protein SAMN05216344_1512 [Polaromonas sp. OV174]